MSDDTKIPDMAAGASAQVSAVLGRIKGKFGNSGIIIHTHSMHGDDTVVVQAEDILEIMEFLRNDDELMFDMMMDLTVVDYLGNQGIWSYLKGLKARFEVVYHLYSIEKNHRVRIKVPISEDNCFINSVTRIWAGANWFEREAWDLYGIIFRGHPDLRRILLYEDFKGHPLRKDFSKTDRQPLIGPKN